MTQPAASTIDRTMLGAFAGLVGAAWWQDRLATLKAQAAQPNHAGRHAQQRHAIELAIERLRARPLNRPPSPAERWIASDAETAVTTLEALPARARDAFVTHLRGALTGPACLAPAFHLLRTARRHQDRGFSVHFAGFAEAAPFDLLIERHGTAAEIACDSISAEDGRTVHRGAWFRLVDRVDPELQTWLRAHPGRYLLKMTLPRGLREHGDTDLLATLHTRITGMLQSQTRADGDEAAVLRLDPLMLAAAQADELGLMPRLRQEFGPEAHLSVTASGGGIFVMAARAAQPDEVATALRRRLESIAPTRLTGTRPGILAMLIEDTDRTEWRDLRERMELEGETRQFLTRPGARSVVAVTCATRLELFGLPAPDAAEEGELRFRNPAHPAARTEALAPAILSTT